MTTTRKITISALVLGVAAIVMTIMAILALMDISGGKEPNLTLEWAVVWAAVAVILMGQLLSIVSIVTLLMRRRGSGSGDKRDTARS